MFRIKQSMMTALVISLALLFASHAAAGTWTPGNFEVHVFQVGQADSQLIVSPTGRTLLIDLGELNWNSGKKATEVEEKMRQIMGSDFDHLDYIVPTHIHVDHIGRVDSGGIWKLLDPNEEGFTVGKLIDRDAGIWDDKNHDGIYDSGTTSGTPKWWLWYATNPDNADKLNREIAIVGSSTQIDLGPDVVVTIIESDANGVKMADGITDVSGDHTGESKPPSENDYCITLKVTFDNLDYVTGGDTDGEYATTSYTYNDVESVIAPRIGQVEVTHVNHHGSAHSTNANYVNTLDPDVSLISCGYENQYHHPVQTVLDRLLATSTVYLTQMCYPRDYNGVVISNTDIVIISSDGVNYTVNADPYVASDPCVEAIEFSYVPPFGSNDNLQGQVSGVDPNGYNVWVYIDVPPYGWWTKPTTAQPQTPIENDGTWVCDITTGGSDQCATKIIAFLVPDGNELSTISGNQCLPSEWYEYPYTEEIRYEKIRFAGYDWWVKRHCDRVGPGPNYFSDSNDNVWVDPNGHLHLKIVKRNDKWYCGEVIADANLGYGTYIFTIKGRVDLLDENIVLGLFTWEDCVPEHNYREIDIEFARWGNPDDPNRAQYVVQPWNTPGNMVRFPVDLAGHPNEITTNIFTWNQDNIPFRSYYGDFSLVPRTEDMIACWSYAGEDIPPSGGENPRINFWLMNGYAPANGQDAEIVIKDFQYLPDVTAEIDFIDVAFFALRWLETNCDTCSGANLDGDGVVDFNDLKGLVNNWLEHCVTPPEACWE
jgi:beta-lactamase superfamily II metal-dependent hydrolase